MAASGETTAGGLRPPIFALRVSENRIPPLQADLLTPGGFDRTHVRAADLRHHDLPRDPYSAAQQRESDLIRALVHYRPIVRLRIDRAGEPHIQASPELSRFENCARHVLRSAIEDQIAVANRAQVGLQQERLRGDFAEVLSPPIESASLLLRLAGLSLPNAAPPPDRPSIGGVTQSDQQRWRAQEIRNHGRNVRLRVDLLSAGRSPAANICRSLTFETISAARRDTCTIEGVIDRRDGWPITLSISRQGQASDAATETQFRSFSRVKPLQGFALPENPCRAGAA